MANSQREKPPADKTPGSALLARIGNKGRTVGEQLVHMHNTRITWTEHVAKSIYDKALLIGKDASPDTTQLATAFSASATNIEDLIHLGWEKEGKLPSFKSGLIPFISYLISHESHHRWQHPSYPKTQQF